MFRKITKFIIDLVFPVECLGCKTENIWLCPKCLATIKTYNAIEKFTEPIKQLNGVIAVCPYEQTLLKKLIHAFKFNYLEELAIPLSKIMIGFFRAHLVARQFSRAIIIPVPLAKKRLLERGFNQSALLAKNFSLATVLRYDDKTLIRAKNTPHQVGLNRQERQTNIKNCFQVINPKAVHGQQIILIDDVVTTGSTLDEAAKCLKEAGAREVWGLVLAKD